MQRAPLLARLASQPALISLAGVEALQAGGSGPEQGAWSRLLSALGRKPGGKTGAATSRAEARIPDALDGRAVERREGYFLADGVAVIRVDGVLWDEGMSYDDGWYAFSVHGYDDLRRAVASASADAAVKGIWLRINSPGGLVSGLFETCAALGSSGKPVTAFVAGDGCSAAYALACSADRVICAPASYVGSIGVVRVHIDASQANERWGVTVTPIQFGAAKTDGAPFKPLSDSARDHFQSQIDTLGLRFAEHVADRRGLTVQAVVATEARVEMDEDALALGLVDEVAAETAAFAAFASHLSAGAPASPPAVPASAQPAAAQEETMSLKQQIEAALGRRARGRASADDTLAQIEAIVTKAETEDDAAESGDEDEEEEEASGDDDTDEDKASGDDDEEEEASGEDDDEDEDKAAAPKRGTAAYALAIMGLPEAKGREDAARQVAATGKFTVAQAQAFLKTLPKATGFRPLNPRITPGAAAGGTDPNARLLAAGDKIASASKPR